MQERDRFAQPTARIRGKSMSFEVSAKSSPIKVKPTSAISISAAFLAVTVALAGGTVRAADCESSPAPGLDWSECSKGNLMLGGNNFQGANLSGADLSSTDLSKTNIAGANFEKANLVRAWFTGAKAEKANFSRIEAYRSGFSNISADGATFAGAELQRANFSGSKLTGVDFEKAELGRANFQKAVLTGTRFTLANLSRADLTSTSFEGPIAFDHAFMYLTRIQGVDLSKAVGLQQAQIDLTCGDSSTKLPAGLTAPKSWPCDSN
jgi:uncharacterized protein YjbI with pentapeptide repeats